MKKEEKCSIFLQVKRIIRSLRGQGYLYPFLEDLGASGIS